MIRDGDGTLISPARLKRRQYRRRPLNRANSAGLENERYSSPTVPNASAGFKVAPGSAPQIHSCAFMSRCSPCIALVSARSTLLAECSPRSRKRSSRGSLEYETARSGTRRSVKSFSSLGANASRHGLFGNTTSRAHESITSAYKPLRSIFIGESCISVTSPSFELKSDYDWKTFNSENYEAVSRVTTAAPWHCRIPTKAAGGADRETLDV
jgi:hypothetical protein